MTVPPCFIHIPAEEYHADARAGKFLSSHLLGDFRRSPSLYHKKLTGEIPPSESPALLLGRAAHSLILEGRAAFDEEFRVSNGPLNPKRAKPTAGSRRPMPNGRPSRPAPSSPKRTSASS